MYPVRLTLLDGTTRWRNVPDFHHDTLCAALNLDPVSTRFDLPKTAYASDRGKERVSGYVMRHGEPIGTIHVAREGERFRDIDPTDVQARLDLRQTTAN